MNSRYLNTILIKILLRKHQLFAISYANLTALSKIIQAEFSENISVNTLARVGGLREDNRKHYKHSLDIVARAAGFFCYDHFVKSLKPRIDLYKSKYPEIDLPFSVYYLEKAVNENDLRYIDTFSEFIVSKGVSIELMYKSAEAIMNGLRENNSPQKILSLFASRKELYSFYFETYVDIDYLFMYYGLGMEYFAKKIDQPCGSFLFANSLAALYNLDHGNDRSYYKHIRKLESIDLSAIDAMLNNQVTYPVARWARVLLAYLGKNKESEKVKQILDYLIEKMNLLNSDDRIILLSELTESMSVISDSYKMHLKSQFDRAAKSTRFEYDSLVNAALNFSVSTKNKPIITKKQLTSYFNNYPFQFQTNKKTLLKKYTMSIKN